MIDDVTVTYDEPHDRLTRLCDAMTRTLDAHPEHTGSERCCVFLNDGERAGIAMHGYDDQTEAVADLLVHLQAMFRSVGKEMQIMFMPDDAGGLV